MSIYTNSQREPLQRFGATLDSDGVSVAPDWRYDLICDYLKASPSYRAVRKLLEGRRVAALPRDLDRVRQVVLDFGDIKRLWEHQWWAQIGMRLYGVTAPLPKARLLAELSEQNSQASVSWKGIDSLIIEIPTALTLPMAMKQVRRAIEDKALAAAIPIKVAAKYSLTTSKLRQDTLQAGLRALRYYEKGMPLWQIGNQLKLLVEQSFDEGEFCKEDHHKISYEKEVLSIAARRLVRKALLIAENAARGRFPSDKPFAEAMMDGYKRKAGRPVGSSSPKRTKARA